VNILTISEQGGGERTLYKWKALAEVWAGNSFRVIKPAELRGMSEKVDIAFVTGAEAGDAMRRIVRLEDIARFRIYVAGWRRGKKDLENQFREIKAVPYHLVFLSEGIGFEEYQRVHPRVFWVERGFDPSVFYPAEKPGDRTIVFVGNTDGFGRLDRLQMLLSELPGRVHWDYGLNHAAMAEFLRSGVIGWNQIQYVEGKVGTNYRVWEVLGCGLLYLGNRTRHCEMFLKDQEHVIYWDNDADLLDKARYYLDHDEERSRIADAGCELAHESHTWKHHALEMKTIVEKYL